MELVYIGLSTLETMYLMDYDMTIGCKYQVADFRPGTYLLSDDNGLTITLSKDCFMSVSEFRDKKIDMIVNE
jgi:hypothetical protein